jgi:hypothetical protein
MLDGDYDKDIQAVNLDYKRLASIVSDIPSKQGLYDYTTFISVNATCYTELAASFRVSLNRLPQVVVYNSKLQMYSKMKAEFTEENVYNFLIDAVESRVMYRKLNRENVIFREKDCRNIKKKAKKVDYEKLDSMKYGYDDEDDDDDIEELNLPDEMKDEF